MSAQRQQAQIADLAENFCTLANTLTDLIEHVRGINEVQHLLFISLINRSPELKDYFAEQVRYYLTQEEEAGLGQRTLATLREFEKYAQSAPTVKSRPHLKLVWPPPGGPALGSSDERDR